MSGARALPAECYRDPAHFEREAERVLRPAWHPVARWDELPEPGDYRSFELCGEPLVLVRDEAQRLRVLSRVCRHRAHTVVEGRGHARSLVCPYHRWSYGLDGSLRSAPLMKEVSGFDAARCGLPELPTTRWQGFLLTTLAPSPPPFCDALGPLDARLAGRRLGELVTLDVLEFDSPWNWKVMAENFMESYHHLGPHAESLQRTNPAQATFCAELEGPFSVLENPGTGEAPSFLVAHVFPTLLLFVQEGEPIAVWYELQIDRVDHFALRIHVLATPELARVEGAAAGIAEVVRQVHLEDIAVCEGVQRGLRSRLWEPGPLARQEECLARFHRHLAERLGA